MLKKSFKTFYYLVIEDGVARGRVVIQLVVVESHACIVVIGRAYHELAGVLVQGKFVEAHRAHEGDLGVL